MGGALTVGIGITWNAGRRQAGTTGGRLSSRAVVAETFLSEPARIRGGAPLKILFFLRAANFDRVFECLLRELLRRGHSVSVALDVEKGSTALFDELAREYAFTYELAPVRSDRWVRWARRLRYSADYLRYLEPEFAKADALRARAQARAPRPLRAVMALPGARSRGPRRAIRLLLRAAERRLPVPQNVREFIAERAADVVLVSPLVGLGSSQGDYLRAAAQLGVPSVLAVASWDNLTNKGRLRDRPSLTVVWNEAQRDEAVRLHGLDPSSVAAVGAHTWDHWFDWQPSTTRQEFALKVGLDPQQPFVLYVCSSRFIAGDEAEFIAEWLRRLRTSTDVAVRELGVMIRPHPQNVAFWDRWELGEEGKSVVCPRGGDAPVLGDAKRTYFDSLYHSACVVGINTSALIEAAVVGRPVLTLITDRFRDTQGGTLHFAHLAGGEGMLTVAHSWPEHHEQLAEALARPEAAEPRIDAFLRSFVRPHGLDAPAAPRAADAVERAAAMTRAR